MAKLTIDLSGRKGLAPRFWGDIDRTTSVSRRRLLGSEGQMADGIWNPFRRYGYLAPANATMQDVTPAAGSFEGQLSTSIYDSENDDFYFGERGRVLWRGDTLDDTTLTSVLDLGSTGTPRILDTEIYQINGVRKFFVIYEQGDALDIAVSNLPYDSTTDSLSWLSGAVAAGTATGSVNATGAGSFPLTAPTSNGEAFMEVADNGFAYLFMENKVLKIDGTTDGGTGGTVTTVFTAPVYFRMVDAIDARGKMFIAIHQYSLAVRDLLEATTVYSAKVGVYVWDRISPVINTVDYIPIQGCKEIRKIYVAPNGRVRVFVVNSENVAVIMEYNGSEFVPIIETGILAYPRFRDSLAIVGGSTIWLGQIGDNANLDGVVFAHGKITPQDTESIYKIGTITDWIAPGAILFGGASTSATSTGFKRHKTGLYLAYATAAGAISLTAFDIYGTGGDGVTALGLVGGISTLMIPLPAMSTIEYIDIHMLNTITSSTTVIGNIEIYFDGVATIWATKNITYADAATGHMRIEVNKPFVNSIQLFLNFDPAIATGGDEFAPFMAVVTYTPTKTKG